MRSLTQQESAVLQCEAGFTTWVRVQVQDADGVWRDMTALEGRDWVRGATINEDVDQPVAQATVTFTRGEDAYNLAPLDTASIFNAASTGYAPLLGEGRPFIIEFASMPLGMAARSTDWRERFRGRIDRVSTSDNTVTVTGRDLGGYIADAFIESERTYGSTAGVAVQTVMQSILTDNGVGSFGLYTPVNPSWNLGPFTQKSEPALDALRTLATQLGWDVRFRWRSDTGAWALTLAAPDRSRSTLDWTFTPNLYRMLGPVESGVEDVRNVWDVVYSDRNDLDAAGVPKRKTVTVQDSVSVAKYGRRWARITEASSSNINTSTEATRLGNAALADMATPAVTADLEVQGAHWHLELGDLVRLAPNAVQLVGTNVDAAVYSLTLAVGDGGEAKTTLRLRGKPSASVREWLIRDARPGIAPTSPFTGPTAPSGLTMTPAVNGFALTFQPPTTGPAPDTYELHVGTSSGFAISTANPSTTLYATSRTSRFELASLSPGQNLFGRVVPRDSKGNRGAASAEVAITTRYVEPRLLLPNISYGALPMNADLEALSDPALPPDNWTVTAGTWGASIVASTDAYAGARAVNFPSVAGTSELSATPFTVREGEVWVVSAWCKQSVSGVRAGTLGIAWMASATGTLGFSSVAIGTSTTPANTWTRAVFKAAVPPGSRYGIVSFSRLSSYTGTLTVDGVDALRAAGFETWRDATLENGWLNGNEAIYGLVQYRKNDLGEVQLQGVAGAPATPPAAYTTMLTLPPGYRPLTRRLFRVGATDIEVRPDGTVRPSAAPTLLPLDGAGFQADL